MGLISDIGDVATGWMDDLLGGAKNFIGDLTGKNQQEEANKINLQIAREMMQFQERMSNTAHVREVKDLKDAGINPMLSAKLGGASTPSGSMATVAPLPSIGGRLISGALDVSNFFKQRADVKEVMSRAELNQANTAATLATMPQKTFSGEVGKFSSKMFDYVQRKFEDLKSSAKEHYRDWNELEKTKEWLSEAKAKEGRGLQRKAEKEFLRKTDTGWK